MPFVPPFSLLGRLEGRYFYVGKGRNFIYYGKESRLFLRINDDTPRNGWGQFTCRIEVYDN